MASVKLGRKPIRINQLLPQKDWKVGRNSLYINNKAAKLAALCWCCFVTL